MAQNYNDTIHKMQTPFEMRAGLPKKEPKMLEDWEQNHVYEQMIKNNEGKPQYILHDGPPYANGNIHMGTALNKIIKDIIIRYKNMSGFQAPYVPGYDTHGLPIELKALSSLGDKKAGVSKLELRQICKEFATEHIGVMNEQFKRLGVQGDFENPYLTLRPEFEARQVEIFGEMAKKGYIYKGMKAVYWCPEDRTALAEAEIEYAEDECDSIYVRFKLTDDPNGVLAKHNIPLDKAWIVIWTTTTWTLPANVATCLNPNLEYAFVKIGDAYHIMARELVESTMKGCHIDEYEVLPETVLGSELELMQYQHPFLDRKGLVILGDHVTLEGGTGCVHTAPGHGVEDFEVCVNHYPQVPVVVPVDDAGRLTAEAGEKFAGLKVWDANKVILEHIKESGHLMGVQHITHQYPHCWRCHHPIIFRATEQWFCSIDKFREEAYKAIDEVKWQPAWGHDRMHGMVRDRSDWCISRQLWWGHQIPAWYCDDCGETVVAKSAPCTCPKCGSAKLTRDPDTLDTWFSSALWPFSTLGWPNEDSADLKYFYPTNTLVTGYDIIGFWVSRMIFSGLAYTGKAPFDTVCIHGIVRDSQGRKMSKSLGNGIDPLEVIAQYGADALRFMLVDGSTPGNDMRYIEKKVEAARNFANKLWNATRFVLMNLPEDFEPGLPCEELLDMSDKWVLTKLNQVAGAMTDNLEHYEMGLAAAKINSFIWDVYCDWFIEIAKPRLNSGDAQQADTARRVLVYVLDKALKLLHPFMPFITEELYQALPGSAETIMTQAWPTFDAAHNWAAEEEAFEKVMDYIKAVRTMRTEMNVHPAKKTSMIIETADAAPFQNAQVYLAKFAFATDVTFTEKYEGSTDGMVQVSTHAARGFIPMMELIDREKELARLNKEKAKAEKEMAMFGNQLNNPKFVERAPAALVEEIRAKFAKSQDKLANIEQSIKALG